MRRLFLVLLTCLAAVNLSLAEEPGLPPDALERIGGSSHYVHPHSLRFAVSPDDRYFASWSNLYGLTVWDAQTGQVVHRFRQRAQLNELLFDSRSQVLKAGSCGAWSVGDWQPLPVPEKFAPLTGQQRYAQRSQGSVTVHNVTDEKEIFRRDLDGAFIPWALDPTESWLAVQPTTSGPVEVWDIEKQEKVFSAEHNRQLLAVAISANRQTLVVSSFGGWVLSWNLATKQQQPAIFAGADVRELVISPDGQRVAILSGGTTWTYDLTTGERFRQLECSWPVKPVAFSKDGKKIFGATQELFVVFDAESGKRLMPTDDVPILHAYVMAVSPDGRYLATCRELNSGSGGRGGRLLVWEIGSKQVVLDQELPVPATRLQFSSDGHTLALDSPRGVEIYSMSEHPKFLKHLPIPLPGEPLWTQSRDSAAVAEVVPDGRIRVTSHLSQSEEERQEGLALQGHESPLIALAFSPDRKLLASTCDAGTLTVWNCKNGDRVFERKLPGIPRKGLALTSEGNRVGVAVGNGVWIGSQDENVKPIQIALGDQPVSAMEASPDGTAFFCGDQAGRLWKLNSADGEKVCEPVDGQSPVVLIRVTPEGDLLAVGRTSGTVEIRRVSDLSLEHTLSLLPTPVTCMAWDVVNNWFAASDAEGGVAIWDWKTKTKRFHARGFRGRVIFLGFSRRREPSLLCRTQWGLFQPLDPVQGKLAGGSYSVNDPRLPPLAGQQNDSEVRSLAFSFSADGKKLATAIPASVRLWDLASGAVEQAWSPDVDCSAAVSFTPDGRTLVAAKKSIRMFPLDGSGRTIAVEGTFQRPIIHLVAAPDGRSVLSVGDSYQFWDTQSGALQRTITPQRPMYWGAPMFTPDSRMLMGWDTDFSQPETQRVSFRIWEVATGEPILQRTEHPLVTETIVDPPFAVTADARQVLSPAVSGSLMRWDLEAVWRRVSDASAQPRPFDAEELWSQLGSADAAAGYQTVRDLVAYPDQTIPMLAERLESAAAGPIPSREILLSLMEDLEAEDLARRRAASNRLLELGSSIRPVLRKILDENPELSPAVKQRLE